MAEIEIYRRETKYHIHEHIFKWIVDIIMVICISFIFSIYLLGKTTVVGHSMEPVLSSGDGALIDKVSYTMRKPQRYDIVVFVPSVANVSKYYVKRIIGLPGETVQIIDGYVYINGEKLEDDVVFEHSVTQVEKINKYNKEEKIDEVVTQEDVLPKLLVYNAGIASEPVVLGYDEYFVLGDNRNNSEDSRFSNVGNVKYSSIIGRIWAVSSPLSHIKIVK